VEKLAGRRWGGSGLHSGGRGSCTAPAAEEAERGAERRQRKKKGGEGSEGLIWKTRKSRDFSIK
jgi:hypothetical protein